MNIIFADAIPTEALMAIFVLTWGAIGFGFVLDLKNARALGEMKIQFHTLVALLGDKFAKILHSPHTPELDALLEKVNPYSKMSPEDTSNLIRMLRDIENNVGGVRPKEERTLAAVLLVLLVEREKLESQLNPKEKL